MMDRNRCCCNCRHCIRIRNKNGTYMHNECEIDKHYIGYVDTFCCWCHRWASVASVKNTNIEKKEYEKNASE